MKKVKLRATKENRIFREVNALSRLSHRFIVRYYTTWFELSEPESAAASDYGSNSEGDSGSTADGMTSVPNSKHKRNGSTDPFTIDMDDLDRSHSQSSFPSIHFTGSGSGPTEDSDGDSDDQQPFRNGFHGARTNGLNAVIDVLPRTPPPPASRTLYIQMVRPSLWKMDYFLFVFQEFVERQTLKEVSYIMLSPDRPYSLFFSHRE